MIPNYENRKVESRGIQARNAFSISLEDQAHIMGILRDHLYSDKVLAVLREYSANAWDAHKEVGKDDVPIQVGLPTWTDPVLTIRDWGPGMSQDDLLRVYTQYGKSTKRDSDGPIGMYGIGSKSGFSYSDTFTVTSWNGGLKRVYIAALDETELGEVLQVHEEACGDETGIEIKIPVDKRDIEDFHRTAKTLFRFFVPPPSINTDLPDVTCAEVSKHGFVTDRRFATRWVAVMGCIPYPINLDMIRPELKEEGGWEVQESASRIAGGLYCDMGSVQISASREALKYTEDTKKLLASKIAEVIKAYTEKATRDLKRPDLDGLTKRKLAIEMTRNLALTLPTEVRSLAASSVALWTQGTEDPPETFSLRGNDAKAVQRYVRTHCMPQTTPRFVIKDDRKRLTGYGLGVYDYLLLPRNGFSLTEVRKEAEELLKKKELDGLPIVLLSEQTWVKPYEVRGKGYNRRYSASGFVLAHADRDPLSNNWEVVRREPQDDDVFVVFERFEVESPSNFYYVYQRDTRAAEVLGISMPDVYGYKSTSQKKVKEEDCKGTVYREWREPFFRKALDTKRARDMIRDYRWAMVPGLDGTRGPLSDTVNKVYELVEAELGDMHLLTKIFRKHLAGYRRTCLLGPRSREAVSWVSDLVKPRRKRPGSETDVEALKNTYPLFDLGTFRTRDKDRKEWIRYIKLVDEDLKRGNNV